MKESQPSATAILIARSLLLAAQEPSLKPALLPGSVKLAQAWLGQHKRQGWFRFAMRHSWARRGLLRLQQAVLPGIFLHYLTRKRLLHSWACDAIQAGCQQVVIIGAGLDSLAWRGIREFPEVTWFELDHPATQRLKRDTPMDQAGPHLVEVDLERQHPAAVLEAHPAFDPNRITLWVAEGLLMYVPEAKVKALFADLAALTPPGSRVAWSFMKEHGGRPAFRTRHRWIDRWLGWMQEPFRWGVDGEPREVMASWAGTTGWALEGLAGAASMREEILAPLGLSDEPLAEGEELALFIRPESPESC